MRKFCIAIAFLSCLLQQGCQKKGDIGNTQNETFINLAKGYFTNQVLQVSPVIKTGNPRNRRTEAAKDILWEKAYQVQLPFGKAVMIPVRFRQPLFLQTSIGGNNRYSLDNLTRLFIYQDTAKNWHSELVTTLPDTIYLKRPKPAKFSGLVVVEDWWGNPLKKLLFGKNGSVRKYSPGQNNAPTENIVIQTCYSIEGYNYAADDPDNGVYWSESLGCSETYIEDEPSNGDGGYGGGDNSGSGSGGATGSIPTPQFTIEGGGPDVIVDVPRYMKCFTNDPAPNHSYKVTVCVAEAVPGTRDVWTFGFNGGYPVITGHSFLIFTETSGTTTITRNIGFYPSGEVDPLLTSSQGELHDNSSRDYTISATYSVTDAQFFNIMGYVMQGNEPGFNYDLNNNNCTTFVIQAMQAGNIFLPSTIGSWLNGSGNDPGDLGEDLRTRTDLQGNPVINTTPAAHPNVGSCN